MEKHTLGEWRRKALIEAGTSGEQALFVTCSHAETAAEHGAIMGMLHLAGISPKRVRRSTHWDIDFESGGRIIFLHSKNVGIMVRGMRLDIAISCPTLSYWDRRDIEATGAVFRLSS